MIIKLAFIAKSLLAHIASFLISFIAIVFDDCELWAVVPHLKESDKLLQRKFEKAYKKNVSLKSKLQQQEIENARKT